MKKANSTKSEMKRLHKQKQKKKPGQLERMLIGPVPETPIPPPFFNIPSPEPYRFPLGQTLLSGIKLLENYFPQDINDLINSKVGLGNVERIARFKDTYCMMGKEGNGLIIGSEYLPLRGITAFSYGPNFLVIAFKDLRLDVYSIQLKLIKTFKKFFDREVSYLKLLQVPRGYENIIFLSHETNNDKNNVYIHRLQKSLLSKFSSKLHQKVLKNLEYPVTQMFQMPRFFRHYLKNDIRYKDCSLICVSSVNRIDIIRVNHFRLNFDNCYDVVYTKKVDQIGSNTISWGQTKIQAPSRQINAQKLVLVCSFANNVYFLTLTEVKAFHSQSQEETTTFEWLESEPFTVKDSQIAFCQFIKKNQLILITENNTVMIVNTKNFQIFERSISSDKYQIFTENFSAKLSSRLIKTITIKSQRTIALEQLEEIKEQIPEVILQMRSKKREKAIRNTYKIQTNSQDLSRSEQESISEFSQERSSLALQPEIEYKDIVTFADSFCYEYPSSEIYSLVKGQKANFNVYVYCDWKLISDLLRVEKQYVECMLFLIAMYKKANKFDLGVEGNEQNIALYIQDLAIQFINKQVVKLKYQKELKNGNIQKILENQTHFKTFIKPIQFLTQTQQFTFLFQVCQEKLIASLMSQNLPYHQQYTKCRKIFFTALIKFIQHGRIKYIPESHLQLVLDYYVTNQRLDMVDRLAIYFDLDKIDTSTVIQCLLQNDLTVSLAHICIQGNQTLFVTPFVKFWGVSANYKYLNQMQNATVYAIRALWYVKLCLQRNWALKQYSFQRYTKMISVLSQHFLSQKIIVAVLQIRPQDCLQALNLYFNIENSMIVNQQMQESFQKIKIAEWIEKRQGNQTLQKLLSAIQLYISKANVTFNVSSRATMNTFLSNIIIYRTVKFDENKYFQILIDLIENYKLLKDIKYGLEDKMLQEFKQQNYQYSQEDLDDVLSSRYIIRTLTLVYYEKTTFIKSRLISIYEKSRQFNLMDLQAEICLLNGQFNNALDIYLRAKPNMRKWIFQFLQNSFKKLILENKKNDKRRLGDVLTSKIKALIELDSSKTKQIVDNYLPEIQQQLIQALQNNPQLQLDYLQQIINNNKTPNQITPKHRLSNKTILKYVELMAKNKSDQLLESFKANTYFPIDQCIKICEDHCVYDCLEYLYEKSGASVQAVKVSMKRIDRILESRSQISEEYLDENYDHYIIVKEILDHSIATCQNIRSQQTWQALLDSSIELYNKYRQKKDFPQDEIQFFFYINGQIMEHMASNCEVQHTIDLLQNKYQNLNMGGKMTKAFITILANLSHSINILYIAESLIEKTYQHFLVEDFFNKIQGVGGEGTCKACHFGIMRRKKSKHFRCHHSYHNQCIIHQNPIVCVYCLLNQRDQFQYHINSINSPMHPKLKKMRQIFQNFNAQSEKMSAILIKQDQEELQKKQDNVIITNAEKKRNKLKGFDDMIAETQYGNRRVLKELRMF